MNIREIRRSWLRFIKYHQILIKFNQAISRSKELSSNLINLDLIISNRFKTYSNKSNLDSSGFVFLIKGESKTSPCFMIFLRGVHCPYPSLLSDNAVYWFWLRIRNIILYFFAPTFTSRYSRSVYIFLSSNR